MRLLILMLFISGVAFAADEEMKLNFRKTLHIYDTTAHVVILNGEEKKAKSFDYNICTYSAEVIRVYKGKLNGVICLMEPCSKAIHSVNKSFFVSFDNSDSQCHFLGAEDKVLVDKDLLSIAEQSTQSE